MKINHLFLIAGIALVAFSCNKEHLSTPSGNNSIIYESKSMSNYKFTPYQTGMTYHIDNVSVYNDILGVVASIASGGKTDDKANWYKDITISNLKLSSYLKIKLSSTSGYNLSTNLTDCKLIYSYYPIDNSGEKKEVLAFFDSYDSANKVVKMIPVSQDLTSLFKTNANNYGDLYLKFSFAQNGGSEYAYLEYSIPFDYDYSYKTKEAKKKE